MTVFEIRGKPKFVSKEELRAMLHATAVVLEYHNLGRDVSKVRVLVSRKPNFGVTQIGGGMSIGRANAKAKRIRLVSRLYFDNMFTASIHELVHIYLPGIGEKCTSTLVNRLKPTISEVYDTLIEGVYERAAYIAHTKLSYKPKGKDFYDDEQYEPIECSKAGEKYRRGRGKV